MGGPETNAPFLFPVGGRPRSPAALLSLARSRRHGRAGSSSPRVLTPPLTECPGVGCGRMCPSLESGKLEPLPTTERDLGSVFLFSGHHRQLAS